MRARSSLKFVVVGLLVAAILGAGVVAGWSRWANPTAHIAIFPGETYQTIDGWEVTPRYWEMNKVENRFDDSWRPLRHEILDRMVNELGINRIRLEYRSGFENPVDYWAQFEQGRISYRDLRQYLYRAINDNDDPAVANPAGFQFSNLDFQVEQALLPLRSLVERNGERLLVNLCFVDFPGPGSTLAHALHPDEYAELTLQTFLHLQSKYGVVPDTLEIILEPDNTEYWRGRQIGLAIVAAAERLRRHGFSPRIIAPSVSKARNFARYFDAMTAVPGVPPLLATAAYHRYDIALGTELPEIRERAMQYRLQTAMLELLTGNADVLHGDLKVMNVSAWQLWGIAGRTSTAGTIDRSVYYEVDFSAPEQPRIHMTQASRGLAQYFRYIRNGAVRIGATTDVDAFDPVAFRNTDGSWVVVVKAARSGGMRISGLPTGDYGVRYTTAAETVDATPHLRVEPGQPLAVSIPAQGVITIHQRRN